MFMKPELIDIAICPKCNQRLGPPDHDQWVCPACGQTSPIQNDIPLFTPLPDGMVPFDKRERGPELGTPWRQANWRFLEKTLATMPLDALILDVGAGRGDFAELFNNRHYLSLDVYAYPEIDVVCDLLTSVPLRASSFDVIVLMNVLEHVEHSRELLVVLARLLKPGGRLVMAVPFLLKIHQAPYDFARYTQFALEKLGSEAGLKVHVMQGYYDPVFLIGESIRNVKFWVLPDHSRLKRLLGRIILMMMNGLASLLRPLTGKGFASLPADVKSPAPVGYQIVFRKE
jgi:SAM-dependent methyltransferase